MIEATELTRKFGNFTAVSQLSLHVPDGSILALLGQNGAGKTTTVRMLSGLLAPTEGEAQVGGYDIRRQPDAVRACVGLITDAPGLFEQMTVPAYLDFFSSIYGLPARERTKRIEALLEFFELTAHRKEKMVGFSKGMKQKVALARALIHEPAVLFLDEPTSGLDPLSARAVRTLIMNLKQSNRSIILCTHDLDEAERLADEIVIMRKGLVAARGTAAALRAQVTGGTDVRIEFAQHHSGVLDLLQGIDGVSEPRYEPKNAQIDASNALVVAYRTLQPQLINPQVLTGLIAVGAQIVSVTCATSSLEDVYATAMSVDTLQLTKSDTTVQAEVSVSNH